MHDVVIENSIGLPESEPLLAGDRPMPYIIIGDNAVAIQEWLMKPFDASPLQKM